MALFDKQLELITEDDLGTLIDDQVREGYQIEYKRSVAFRDKQDKLDFLASVTSFANSVGGDLLIGVAAASGVPTSINGWEGVDVDLEKQRIENVLRNQVEPRLGFRVHEVRLRNGNAVLLLRVPWSWAQPHMVRMDETNRFYYRHSAGKDVMNVQQLRAAFALSTRLDEQIAAFRRERVAAIKAGTDGHLSLPPGPTLIVHTVPFESLRSGFTLDLEAAMKCAVGRLLPLGTGSNLHAYNLEGICCADDPPSCNAYTQVFRNAAIESTNRGLLVNRTGRRLIPCGAVPRDALAHVQSVIGFYRALNVSPPAVVMLSIVGVQEYEFAVSTEMGVGYYARTVGREDLLLPEVLIQDFTTSPVDLCRPLFDALYNAAGYAKWPEYEQYKQRE
jgi:hypothetical protein